MNRISDEPYFFKPLAEKPQQGDFFCGVNEIDKWYFKDAWDYHNKFRCRVTTIHSGENGDLVGFYAFCVTLESERLLDKSSHLHRFSVGRYFPTLQIYYIAVQKSLQKGGIGTIAMGKIIDTFREVASLTGVPVMTLTAINQRAANLYASMGFVRFGGPGPIRMLLPAQSVLDLTTSGNPGKKPSNSR